MNLLELTLIHTKDGNPTGIISPMRLNADHIIRMYPCVITLKGYDDPTTIHTSDGSHFTVKETIDDISSEID